MTDTQTAEPTPIPETDDPSAPYGRDGDGTLLDRHGQRAERGLRADGTAKAKPGPASGTTRPLVTRKTSKTKGRKTTRDFRAGIVGLVQIPVGVLTGLGTVTGSDPFLADAVTLSMHADPISEALNELAQENRQLAGVLEKVIAVGPYSALIAAGLGLSAQIARNHALIPAGAARMLGGSHDPADLAQAARTDLEALDKALSGNGE